MTVFPYAGRPCRLRRGAAAILAIAALGAGAMAVPALGQEIASATTNHQLLDIPVDEARVLRLGRVPRSVIIGNPLIADAVVEDNGVLILIGKNYGTTNLIALDEAGNELANFDLAVRTSGSNALSLYRGSGRVSYNCTPRCEMELDVGDEAEHFDVLRNEITGKTGLSQGQISEDQ